MTCHPATIEALGALAARAQDRAGLVYAVLADERQEITPARRAALADAALEAEHTATACVKRLLALGAPVPGVPQERSGLADLLALEGARPDLETLHAGLLALLPLAERIDAARGRSLPEPVAGSAGLDLAEDLAQLLARIELDLYGPGAALTGARE